MMSGFLAGAFGLVSVTQWLGQQACKPTLSFKEVRISDMLAPTLERKWIAVVSVDAHGYPKLSLPGWVRD